MDIRFVSSLSPDDEIRFAAPLLGAIVALLDRLPIAYSLRIEASAGDAAFEHTRHPEAVPEDVSSHFLDDFKVIHAPARR
jgi:hypothetical protein